MPTVTKRCSICHTTKTLDAFYKEARATDGHQARCKECHLAQVQAYRRRNQTQNEQRDPFVGKAKRCGSCRLTKSREEFHRNRSSRDGLHWVCRDCNSARRPSAKRAERRRRFRTYNITPEGVAELEAAQQGRCAICRRAFLGRNFHIDHCHRTERVRGLLCARCNTGLGLFGDDATRLMAASAYLELPPNGPAGR